MSAATVEPRERVVVVGGDETTPGRLTQAAQVRPDLGEVVPFWVDIYRVQFAAREELAARRGPFDWALRRERLLAGQPQLEPEDLRLDSLPLEAWVRALAEAWRPHDPERVFPAGEDWLALVRQAFQDPSLAPGQRADLGFAETLAALALAPCLEWAAAGVAPGLAGELEAWGRGRCPVCGGYPDLAVLAGEPASRTLVCSRCNALWPYPRVGCPFCRDVEHQVYHVDDEGAYRLYLCPQCRRYLKTVDARRAGGRVDPWAERLLTIGMDLAALEAGYGPEKRRT